jgi:hypothetical protein
MVLNPLIIVAEVLCLWGPEGPLVLEVDASRRQGRLVSFWCLCSLLIKVELPLRHPIHGSCL